MEPGWGQEAGHSEEQESERTDRIAKWVQQFDDNEPAASSVANRDERGTEAGLLSDLLDECLQTIRQLRSTLDGAGNSEARPDEKARLGHCYAKLNLWGDALHKGNLEASLRVVPALRSTILEALIKIGQALLLACETHSALSRIIASEHYQERTSSLKLLVDRALDILTAQDSDLYELRDGKITEAGSSGFGIMDKKPADSSFKMGKRTWVLALLRTLTFRTRLLMELLPTIQQILTTADRGKRHQQSRVPEGFCVSEAAQQWVRQVFDKFEAAKKALAERLGVANAQRYDEIRLLKSQHDAPAELVKPLDGAKPLFGAPTTIHDSGLGTSIVTPADDPVSDASYSSFASSVADEGSRRVPKTPEAVNRGKSFECEICGSLLWNIKNRAHWKAHVFADIKPYICTFGGCKDQFTVFPTRKGWAEHEFSNHRCHIKFACYDCPEQLATQDLLLEHLQRAHSIAIPDPQRSAALILTAKKVEERPITEETCPLCQRAGWQLRRAFIKHLGKHMEDIALLALPPNDDSGDEEERERSYDEESRATSPERFAAEISQQNPEEKEDANFEPRNYFLPGEGVDLTLLVQAVSRFVGPGDNIRLALHPTDPYRAGINVWSRKALSEETLRNIVNVSKFGNRSAGWY